MLREILGLPGPLSREARLSGRSLLPLSGYPQPSSLTWKSIEVEATQRVGLYSIAVNIFLVSLKFGLASLTGSLALTADAVHSFVDLFGSVVVLGGLLISQRKSKSFPYGLYKVENFAAVILALLIFLAGYEIAQEALATPNVELADVNLALAGVVITILVAYLFSRYERRVGRQTQSPSLMADSQHFRTDVLASGVVFVAILGNYFGLPLDRIGAIVVLVFIVWAGWGLLVDGMRVLLDASLDARTLEAVRRIISTDKNVIEIKSLVGRNSGRYKFIEVEVILRSQGLERAHYVSQRLDSAIREAIPNVDRVLIHYEPQEKAILRWAVPLDESRDRISPHLGQAPFFALVDVHMATGEVVDRHIIVNPHLDAVKQKGIVVAEFLIGQGIDGLIVRESHEGKAPYYVLSDAGVQVVVSEIDTLDKAVDGIRQKQDASVHAA